MEHVLPELPYSYDSLEPFIDARTMEIHHTKHHQAYINNLNNGLKGEPSLQSLSVEQLLRNIQEVPEGIRTVVRNHGGGHANHLFFWQILKKEVAPAGEVVSAIEKKFGSLDGFKSQFVDSAVKLFGSGWAWLVVDRGELELITTPNQDSPVMQGKTPVIGIDVWEHAYYLNYQNRRPDYAEAFFNVINWEKVNEFYQLAGK